MKLKTYLRALRAPFFTGIIVPVALGASIAWNHMDTFYWGYFLLTLLGAILLHAGANTANDYFDHVSGTDEANVNYHTPIYGGSRLIQNGVMKPKEMLAISLICFTIGSAIGIYFVFTHGLSILWLGLIGVLGGFFYTAPPISLASRGFGELAILVNFGIVPTLGAYYIQTRSFSLEVFLVSIPVGILMTNILIINEFPDYQADKQTGKRHLVVRLGKERARWLYFILFFAVYTLILFFVSYRLISHFTLLSLLTIPIAIKVGIYAWKNYASPDQLLPSNIGTIIAHVSVGFLLCLGYILQKLL